MREAGRAARGAGSCGVKAGRPQSEEPGGPLKRPLLDWGGSEVQPGDHAASVGRTVVFCSYHPTQAKSRLEWATRAYQTGFPFSSRNTKESCPRVISRAMMVS